MPKRTVYTCDCCGVEYEEPNLFNNEFISQFRFDMHRKTENGEYNETYGIKKINNDNNVYLCPNCTKQFIKKLSEFGFTKLVNTSAFEDNEIKI